MNIVTILTLVIVSAFLIYTGVIPSISDAYRTVKDKRIYHMFFALAGALVACQQIYAQDKFAIPYSIAGFLIWSISMAAAFWNKREGILHVCFTYSGFFTCLLLTILQIWPKYGALSLLVPAAFAAGYFFVHFFIKANKTYWQEVWLIVCALGPLIKVL